MLGVCSSLETLLFSILPPAPFYHLHPGIVKQAEVYPYHGVITHYKTDHMSTLINMTTEQY